MSRIQLDAVLIDGVRALDRAVALAVYVAVAVQAPKRWAAVEPVVACAHEVPPFLNAWHAYRRLVLLELRSAGRICPRLGHQRVAVGVYGTRVVPICQWDRSWHLAEVSDLFVYVSKIATMYC